MRLRLFPLQCLVAIWCGFCHIRKRVIEPDPPAFFWDHLRSCVLLATSLPLPPSIFNEAKVLLRFSGVIHGPKPAPCRSLHSCDRPQGSLTKKYRRFFAVFPSDSPRILKGNHSFIAPTRGSSSVRSLEVERRCADSETLPVPFFRLRYKLS